MQIKHFDNLITEYFLIDERVRTNENICQITSTTSLITNVLRWTSHIGFTYSVSRFLQPLLERSVRVSTNGK